MNIQKTTLCPTFNGKVLIPGILSKEYEAYVYPHIGKLVDNPNFDFKILEQKCNWFYKLVIQAFKDGKTVYSRTSSLFESYESTMKKMLKALNIK